MIVGFQAIVEGGWLDGLGTLAERALHSTDSGFSADNSDLFRTGVLRREHSPTASNKVNTARPK